ncbi:MAG: hypothetical protein PHP08_00190 [Candidatus Dojkabacteria bacterium]|nr:hypothetical protein [Candidatus Dojkabacteria bacterium]
MVTDFTIIDNLRIRTNDRVAIFGRTGSGKTHLAKNWLLPHYDKYVFWDIKHENTDVEHDIVINTPRELKKNITKYNKILYQPDDLTDRDFNSICEIIFDSKDNSLYVDEAALITTPSKIQYWHKVIATQGRSYNVGIINVSQRPRDIHNTLISESEHLLIFSLSLETDIIKIRQQVGTAADEIYYLPKYHFLYHNVETNKSYIFKPIKSLTTEQLTEKKIPKLELYRPDLEEYVMLTTR